MLSHAGSAAFPQREGVVHCVSDPSGRLRSLPAVFSGALFQPRCAGLDRCMPVGADRPLDFAARVAAARLQQQPLLPPPARRRHVEMLCQLPPAGSCETRRNGGR